jgi:ABC-type branched-subunit amino acid transport system ATPase component
VSEALLVVEDVAGGYRRDYQILRNVCIQVREGEIVALIGPNGAGKSTLLKAICGNLPHVRGSIRFRGEEIRGLKPYQTLPRGLAYVPQGRRVFPVMTVRENLEMGAHTLRDRALVQRRMETVFNLFPVLADKASELAYRLSGGEQQMLAIARGLMLTPSLLMLDEPSLGLAPRMAALVFDKIVELSRSGVTILLVEQRARQALRVSTRGYVMVLGETRMTDTASNLLYSEEVLALYLGQAPAGGTQ